MNELFGSSAPIWTGMSTPGFGWLPPGANPGVIGTSGFGPFAPPPGSTGGLATAGPGLPASSLLYGPTPQPYGIGSGTPVAAQPNPPFGPAGPGIGPIFPGAPGPFGVPAGFLPAVVHESSITLAAPAILATVAMRRGQPMGPTNDQEIEDFIYDALEFVPGTSEVEVRCEAGRAILTGSVQHKRLKRDVGEIAWAIPHVSDLENNVTIATRRRPRAASREVQHQTTAAGRKQA